MVKILCIGPLWRGSDAGALFRALARIGYLTEIIDDNYFVPLNAISFTTKVISKLGRGLFIRDFNHQVLKVANQFQPNICLIYKGAFIQPETLRILKSKGIGIINFYPDVSFHTHGNLLPITLPMYDHIFTTKTFGIYDMKQQLGITNSTFIPHGFDPEIHRPLPKIDIHSYFQSDVSFIGTWSPKKEYYLSKIKNDFPSLNLKIWGHLWQKASKSDLADNIQNSVVNGDLFALAISNSKINLGLLSEKVRGSSLGDQITSRTFQIPGAGGFLLHERTDEALQYFKENEEAGFFGSPDELVSKIDYFLNNNNERIQIAENGKRRAWEDYKLDNRAQLLIQKLYENKIL